MIGTVYTLRLVDSDGNTVAEAEFETDLVKQGYYGDASGKAQDLLNVAFARTEKGVEAAAALAEKRGLTPTFIDADERAYFDRYGFVVRVERRGELDDGTQFVHLAYGDPVKGLWSTQLFEHYRAFEDAASFVGAMEESATTTLEERLGPFGTEWAREQEERRGER